MPECAGNAAGEVDKLNAAFAYGSAAATDRKSASTVGMSCAADAITNASGVELNDTLAVTMQGIRDIIDSRGGIELPIDAQGKIATKESEKVSSQTFSGYEVTELLRERKQIDDGSDLSRIARQQKVMTAMLQALRSSGELSLSNLADGSLLTMVNVAARETDSFLSLDEIKDLVDRLASTPVNTVSLPTVLAEDGINVDWNDSTDAFFAAYKSGEDLPE